MRALRHERMFRCSGPGSDAAICAAAAAGSVIMNDMAYCELCDMDLEFCGHGLAGRHANASANASQLLISPNGMAHFPGCPHKGDDPDYSRWAALETPRAWERLGNGERLPATGGLQPSLIAKTRCQDCVSHGPW